MGDLDKTKLLLHPKNVEQAFARIRRERVHQDREWGEQNHTWDYWLGILMEEVGELAQAIVERNPVNIDAELTQVAAVAVAMMEYGDRKGFSTREDVDGFEEWHRRICCEPCHDRCEHKDWERIAWDAAREKR